jgi:large subunit ribosomal protein L40e
MQIFVRGNRTIVIEVEPTDTVLVVKDKIWDREGIPVKYQMALHGGRILENHKTLVEYDIVPGSTVHYQARFGIT